MTKEERENILAAVRTGKDIAITGGKYNGTIVYTSFCSDENFDLDADSDINDYLSAEDISEIQKVKAKETLSDKDSLLIYKILGNYLPSFFANFIYDIEKLKDAVPKFNGVYIHVTQNDGYFIINKVENTT